MPSRSDYSIDVGDPLFRRAEDSRVRPYFDKMAVTDLIGKLALPEVVSVFDACDVVSLQIPVPCIWPNWAMPAYWESSSPPIPQHACPKAICGRIVEGHRFACRPVLTAVRLHNAIVTNVWTK